MRRRQLLRSGALTLPLLAGCVSTPDNQIGSSDNDSTGLPREAALDTHAWSGSPTLTVQDAPYPQGMAGPYYVSILRSEADATTFRDSADSFPSDAKTFLTRTDFEGESVVVIHDQKGSSHPNLAVDSVARDHVDQTEGVHVTAHYPGDVRTADLIENSLLVRVAGHPEFARTTIGTETDAPTIATTNAITASRLDTARSLVVRNRDCQSHRFHVQGEVDGNIVVWESVEIDAGQISVVEDVFPYAAAYDMAVVLSAVDQSATDQIELTTSGTRNVLVDIDAAGMPAVTTVDGSPQERRIECETRDRPYESSDPQENVDDPVDLWIVKQSTDPQTLTVSITESGTQVFQQAFEFGEGKAKTRETDLLAKKAVYRVRVESDAGTPAVTEFEVTESVSKLTVHIDESGELSMVAN